MLRRRAVLTGLTALASGAPAALAQMPGGSREILFIVPWNAGGSNDILARQLQPLLKEQGISIIIENAVGATGSIGLRRVAAADPDGYTLGMGTSSTLALIAQNKTPLRNEHFTHLARVSVDPLMLIVPGSSPHKTIEQFIAFMKANPGKVSIGTPGNFNLNHIFASMTARAADVAFLNVPYTGGSKVVSDLAGAQIDAGVLKPSESLGQITEGLVRALGVFATERLALFPDVPTFKERGVDVFPFGPVTQMAYVVAPARLPREIAARLTAAFQTAINDPRFKSFADKNAFLVENLTGEALTREVDDVAKAISVVAVQVFKET